MAFGKKFSKVAHKLVKGKRSQWKKLRKHVGLTSDNKWVRSIRKSLHGQSLLASNVPTGASSVYVPERRSISQLMGGS